MPTSAVEEVVPLVSELIRIDTTNTGNPDTLIGERAGAEWVATQLSDVGYETTYVESGAKGRGNVVARLSGANPERGALLIQGHLDVVPAEASDWRFDPFAGEVADGYVWGRGAVDMKDMVGMTLALARQYKSEGYVPPRDLVFAFVADEEAGGTFGAEWLVDHRPELFEGVTEAISEVGGFSVAVGDDVRAYLIQTAEKGLHWMQLKARGKAGHGSMIQEDNAVTRLAAAVSRVGGHTFPVSLHPAVKEFLQGLCELMRIPFDPEDPETAVAQLGNLSRMIGATLRDTANPTMLRAGYKTNVVPQVAEATIDGRVLPGHEEGFAREIRSLVGEDIEIEVDSHPSVETSFDGDLVDAMVAAIVAEDPGARCLPYMMSGGTDAKAFQRLGIRNFGFSPLKLPADLDFWSLFHGVDERVPTDALHFGVRVLDRLLRSC